MSDYRNQLVDRINEALVTVLDTTTLDKVSRKIIRILDDYEIAERRTELAVYDDENERLLKRYCACILVEGKSKNTVYGYRQSILRFFDFIKVPVTQIGAYEIRLFLATEKDRGISEATLASTRARISAFFKWLHDEEVIAKNPCAIIKPIKVPDVQKFPFSSVELDALRCACKNIKERAIIELLVSSGVRVAELTHLDITDIDFSNMTVRVRQGKGGKDRTTYLNDVAKLYLQKYLLTRKDNDTALFINHLGVRIQNGGIRAILNALGKRAGVAHVHPHRFRRTLASTLAASGMAIQEIQQILGHSNINTTIRYIKVNDQQVKASYQKHIA